MLPTVVIYKLDWRLASVPKDHVDVARLIDLSFDFDPKSIYKNIKLVLDIFS